MSVYVGLVLLVVCGLVRWRGEVDVHKLSSTLSLLWAYEFDALFDANKKASVSEIVTFLEIHPRVRDSVRETGKICRALRDELGEREGWYWRHAHESEMRFEASG